MFDPFIFEGSKMYKNQPIMNAKIKAVQQFHEAFKIGYSTTQKADLGICKKYSSF